MLTFRSDEILNNKLKEFDNYVFNDKNQKHLKAGYASFITELYNFEIIERDNFIFIVSKIIKNIIKNKSHCEDYVECLFNINKTVKDKQIFKESLSEDINLIANDKEISTRIRFKLMDIKDSL